MELFMQIIALVLGVLIIIFFIALYFLPTIIAYKNKHMDKGLIFLKNLFLGITIIGYFVLLFKSLSDDNRELYKNMVPKKYCPICRKQVKVNNSNICLSCQNPIDNSDETKNSWICKNCGTKNKLGNLNCFDCGSLK
jgi:glucan phosphoethanolaminetransferase (alkaline phosphatase superfamily)